MADKKPLIFHKSGSRIPVFPEEITGIREVTRAENDQVIIRFKGDMLGSPDFVMSRSVALRLCKAIQKAFA